MSDKLDADQVFSYPVVVDDIPIDGLDLSIVADAETMKRLAKLNNIPAIARLDAQFHLSPKHGQRINVSGELRAMVTQLCVVTLEPFESEIVEPIDVDFAPPELVPPGASVATASEDDPLAPDPPDPIVDGKIDLGALAAEFLALGLDPYPRKPGVNFEPPKVEDAPDTNPFSVLNRLKEGG